MKKLLKLAAIIVAVFLVLGVVKNGIAQTILTSTLSSVMHVPVKVGSVDLGILSASGRIKNLKVYNPAGFPDRLMLHIPQIFIDLEPGELFQGRAHFKAVKLELKELNVIRDKSGRLNVDAVKPTQTQQEQAKKAEKAKKAGEVAKPQKLLIDKLTLSIGRVTYKDYSAGGEPAIQIFDVNIQNREYLNIDNPTALVSVIMFEALTRTTLSKLADLDLHSFKEGGLTALSESLGAVGNSAEAVQNTAKNLLNLFN